MGDTGIQINNYVHEYCLNTNSHKRVGSFVQVNDDIDPDSKYKYGIVLQNV